MQVKCPNCQKTYKVKEEFAGKKATCQSCKKPFTIPPIGAPAAPAKAAPAKPVPVSAPAKTASAAHSPIKTAPAARAEAAGEAHRQSAHPSDLDLEAMAAAALADEPKGPVEVVAPPVSIDFPCEWCDEKISVKSELAGRQAQCPHCKRIIRVPQLRIESNDGSGWRSAPTRRPSGARQEEDAAPKDAWGSEVGTSTVSRHTLAEVGAVPEIREPLSIRKVINRCLLGLVVLIAGVLAWSLVSKYRSESLRDQALALALKYEERKDILGPLDVAAVEQAAGEYFTTIGESANARKHFTGARGLLQRIPPSANRDALLIDLAVRQADLIVEPEILKKSISKDAELQQKWSFVELGLDLNIHYTPEARAEAFRAVTAKLIKKKVGEQAPLLASEQAGDPDRTEFLAAVALELWQAGEPLGGKLADQMGAPPSAGSSSAKPAKLSPSLVALLLVAGKPMEEIEAMLKPKAEASEYDTIAWRMGIADGLTRKGEVEKARAQLEDLKDPLDILRVQIAIAVAALEKDPKNASALEDVAKAAEGLKDLLLETEKKKKEKEKEDDKEKKKELTSKPDIGWMLMRLIRLAAANGHGPTATRLSAVVPDAALRGQAQLIILRNRLKDGVEPETVLDEVEKETLAHCLARELLARHNTRNGKEAGTFKTVESLPELKERPYGYIGIALGILDSEK